MTESEIKNIKTGDYICLVSEVYKGKVTEDSKIEEPKKVTRVAYKGICEGEGEYFGRPFVVFHHESYFMDETNTSASCYSGEVYYIVPTESQRKRWRKSISYKKFMT